MQHKYHSGLAAGGGFARQEQLIGPDQQLLELFQGLQFNIRDVLRVSVNALLGMQKRGQSYQQRQKCQPGKQNVAAGPQWPHLAVRSRKRSHTRTWS